MEGGNVASLNGNVDEIDNIDLDIDFDVNEAGRSIALGKYDSINESQFDTMNFGQKGNIRIDNDLNLGNFTPASIGEPFPKHTNDDQSTSRSEYSAKSSFSLSSQLQSQRSEPRAIPTSTMQSIDYPPSSGSRPSSTGSTGTAFLNNILNPASTFNSTHLSHTPPTQVSTSYEVSHFGKRPRSGVSIKSDFLSSL